MTAREMRERQRQLVEQARAKLNEITDETTAERASEIEAEYDRIMADHDRLEARAQRDEALAQREAEQRERETRAVDEPEPREAREVRGGEDAPTYDQVFDAFLRHGPSEMSSEHRSILRERRAQGAGTDSAGGYTVPDGFVAELIRAMLAYGPMLDPGVTRQIATATGAKLEMPTMDDTSNVGAILAENTQDTEQDIAFSVKELDAYKYTSKIIRVSEELLQDGSVNVEAIIRDAMAERLGRIVNQHLTVGTGTNQPNGIVTATAKGADAAAAAISFDNLIDLEHSIDPAYRNANCRFMFNDGTLKLLRKIKDSEGNYIWQPADVRTGGPATILGYGYAVNQAMADVGTANKSVVFGDMSRYVVRRVREFAAKRLVERYADFYQVGFLGFGRFDGELLDAGAVKHMLHA